MTLSATDIRNLVFTGVATIAGALLAPGLPFLGIPLAAAALGWLAYRHGYGASIAAALLATVAVVVLSGLPLIALYLGPALLAAGPAAAWGLTHRPAIAVTVVLALVLTISAVGFDTALAMSRGRTLLGQQAAESEMFRKAVLKSSAEQQGTDPKTAMQVQKWITDIADRTSSAWRVIWPSAYLYLSAIAALIAIPLVVRAARAQDRTVSAWPPLPELDVNPHFVWLVIGGLALLAAAVFLHRPVGWMHAIGFNLLLAVRPVLFLQGLGCFAALYRKAEVGRMGRTFGFTFLALSEMVVPSVSLLGLADLFVNFRRQPRGTAHPEMRT